MSDHQRTEEEPKPDLPDLEFSDVPGSRRSFNGLYRLRPGTRPGAGAPQAPGSASPVPAQVQTAPKEVDCAAETTPGTARDDADALS